MKIPNLIARLISGLVAALGLMLLLTASGPCLADPPLAGLEHNGSVSTKPLRIISQGGAYQQSQVFALFQPFRAERGIPVQVSERSPGPLTPEAVQTFDVIDLPAGDAARACADGLLETIDVTALIGEGARKDFIPGALSECAIGGTVWSAFFVYNTRAFIDRRVPLSIVDVFDLSRQPGKRVFPRSPRYLFEAALLADQVPPSQIYRMLETPAGITRAFLKLERLKAQIVWAERPADGIRLIQAPETAFALAFSAQAFRAIVQDRLPLNILWNGQIYDVNVWGIAKDTPRLFDARDFIKFALDPKRLASQTRWFPYGPARLSAAALVTKYADINIDMAPWLPTAPANFKNALPFSEIFWAVNEATLTERFIAWADGKIDPAGAIILPKLDPALKGKVPLRPR